MTPRMAVRAGSKPDRANETDAWDDDKEQLPRPHAFSQHIFTIAGLSEGRFAGARRIVHFKSLCPRLGLWVCVGVVRLKAFSPHSHIRQLGVTERIAGA